MGLVRAVRREASRIVKTGWFWLEVAGHRRRARRTAFDPETRRWLDENLAVVTGRATELVARRRAGRST